MSVSYTIGEVAAITHLSIPTIRYYDKEGLIPDLQKDQAGSGVLPPRILAHWK